MAARASGPAVHVCYHSGLPNHLYGGSRQYLRDQPRAVRPLFAAAIPGLRAYDRRLVRRPGRVITNSAFSAREIERVHGRKVEVVHPPVRTHFFTPAAAPRRHFLVVARVVTYKRVDVVIDAFRGLEADLVVAGDGPQLEDLRRTAPPNVRFVGSCGDDALLELYRSSRGVICPSIETFGLAMAEAHATGTPVIGLRAGGALEVVTSRETGILVDRPDPRSIAEAVRALDTMPLCARACRESAERFAQSRFTDAMHRILEEELASGSVRPPPAPRR
jgi:glycosyltransferase involved in cell wall biosynthesis